jgi:dolichol-phosphate mannosyltransferase
MILMAWVFISGLKGHTVPGWASTLTGYSLGQSVTLLLVGVIGMYIERIYLEVQNRPHYIVRKEIVKPTATIKNE